MRRRGERVMNEDIKKLVDKYIEGPEKVNATLVHCDYLSRLIDMIVEDRIRIEKLERDVRSMSSDLYKQY